MATARLLKPLLAVAIAAPGLFATAPAALADGPCRRFCPPPAPICVPVPAPCVPCGHWEDRPFTVCVSPGHFEPQCIPALVETRFDPCGRPFQVVLRPEMVVNVWCSPRYETRCTRIWVQDPPRCYPGYAAW